MMKTTVQEEIQDASHLVTVKGRRKRRIVAVIAALLVGATLLAGTITLPLLLSAREEVRGQPEEKVHTGTKETSQHYPRWSEWGSWTFTNLTYANSTKTRERNCTNSLGKRVMENCKGLGKESLTYYRDCLDLYRSANTTQSGVYDINPNGRDDFPVYCDMTTDGGGWTVFQRRKDGAIDFNQNWDLYKTGFGNLTDEFWLGNDKINWLTRSSTTVLRVELQTWGGERKVAKYGSFRILNESRGFELFVNNFSGSAGDSLKVHNAMKFSTPDRDNDCAQNFKAGWWFVDCLNTNLNGQYLGNTIDMKGIVWYAFHNNFQSLKFTEMMIRRDLMMIRRNQRR